MEQGYLELPVLLPYLHIHQVYQALEIKRTFDIPFSL